MNFRKKRIDNTFLSLDMAEARGFIHRDYLAHCLRWSHAVKLAISLQNKSDDGITIVDVGCGKEVPMGLLLFANRIVPKAYYAVDMVIDVKRVEEKLGTTKFWPSFKPTVGDLVKLAETALRDVKSDLVTCFEVAEHVEIQHWCQMAKVIHGLLSDKGVFLCSTPIYNGQAAKNHVNEMYFKTFGATLEDAGFEIVTVNGTFASQKDIWARLEERGLVPFFEELNEYYDSSLISVILAPLFPEESRNAIWTCRKAGAGYARQFPTLAELPKPWGSSDDEAVKHKTKVNQKKEGDPADV